MIDFERCGVEHSGGGLRGIGAGGGISAGEKNQWKQRTNCEEVAVLSNAFGFS